VKTVGNSSRGRSQGVPKIFRAPMYMAHCAVIFAIAQLSCTSTCQGKSVYVSSVMMHRECFYDDNVFFQRTDFIMRL